MSQAHHIAGTPVPAAGVFILDTHESKYFGKPWSELGNYERKKLENFVFFTILDKGMYKIEYKI